MLNAQMTAFLVGVEWTHFASGYVAEPAESNEALSTTEAKKTMKMSVCKLLPVIHRKRLERPTPVRKTLRVSAPVGIQRSSYFVSMPLRYGIPLISTMSLLHWLISQSLFVVATTGYGGDGIAGSTIYTSAYSLQAIIAGLCPLFQSTRALPLTVWSKAMCVGFVLTCALFVLGFRQYPDTIPLVSSCSAAISAACHPPEGDEDAAFFPLKWGVVTVETTGEEQSVPGHCSLSTDRFIQSPQPMLQYA
jgi:hypothetical protein